MRMNMKRPRKSNSVSWAPGVNLRQVKLFSPEDLPVKVGLNHHNLLQKKASYMLRSVCLENDLPPGFESKPAVSQAKVQRPSLPKMILWKCPSKVVLSPTWQVAAGEESEEAKAQKLREMRVLEAVYPRFAAIPPNPSVSLEVADEHYDDSLTPVVSLIPIEEEFPDSPSDQETPLSTATTTSAPQTPALPQGLPNSGISDASNQPANATNLLADVTAAALSALTAIMISTEKGNVIDTDFLIKILSDPKMIENLINAPGPQANAGAVPTNTFSAPMSKPTTTPSAPQSLPSSDMQRTAGGNFFPKPGTVGTAIPPGPSNVQVPGPNRPAPPPPLSGRQPSNVQLPGLNRPNPPRPLSGPQPSNVQLNRPNPAPPLSGPQPPNVQQPRLNRPGTTPPMSGPQPPNVQQPRLNRRGTTPPMSGPQRVLNQPAPPPPLSNPQSSNVQQPRLNRPAPPPRMSGPQFSNFQQPGLNRSAPPSPMSNPQPKFVMFPRPPNQNQVHPNLGSMTQANRAPPVRPPFPVMGAAPPPAPAPALMNVNHFKDLIMQHGGQNPSMGQIGNNDNHLTDLKMVQNFNPGEMNPKNQRPCMYYSTPRGCRNGVNCTFLHDMSFDWRAGNIVEAHSAKRMKLDGVNVGRI